MKKVLVVLTNYSRPQNMPQVIDSWWRQSHKPARVVVVDNSPLDRHHNAAGEGILRQEQYPKEQLVGFSRGTSDVWRWTENSGCCCHLAPALMLHGHDYTLFADDDFLPGTRALENLVEVAGSLGDRFSTLGQIGRRLKAVPEGYSYDRRNVPRKGDPERVDIVCRSSMIKADRAIAALLFRDFILEATTGNEVLADMHDDFVKSIGIQCQTKQPSYVIPEVLDVERNLIKTELGNGSESVWKRPSHFEERERFARLCTQFWRSLV